MALTAEKIVVVTPTQSAMQAIAIVAKPGAFRSPRAANRKSLHI